MKYAKSSPFPSIDTLFLHPLPYWTFPLYVSTRKIAYKFDSGFQYMFDLALKRASSTIQVQAEHFSNEVSEDN